jgi:hypothetical protein
MDAQTWQMLRTLARYVIFLAVVLIAAQTFALFAVIWWLPHDFAGKEAIIAGLAGGIASGMAAMVGAVGAAFVALVNTRRNVSVREAQGEEVKPGG